MNIFVNILIYQGVWFLGVLYGDRGGLMALSLLALHFVLSPRRLADLKIMVVFVAAGLLIDSLLQMIGVLTFFAPSRPIPFWLMVIWAGLATLPLHGLRWMQGRHLINVFFGALGGPLAYWAGARLGAASFPHSDVFSLVVLAVVWAVFWPLAMHAASRLSNPFHPLDRARGKG
jgi:hypothetical protein